MEEMGEMMVGRRVGRIPEDRLVRRMLGRVVGRMVGKMVGRLVGRTDPSSVGSENLAPKRGWSDLGRPVGGGT